MAAKGQIVSLRSQYGSSPAVRTPFFRAHSTLLLQAMSVPTDVQPVQVPEGVPRVVYQGGARRVMQGSTQGGMAG